MRYSLLVISTLICLFTQLGNVCAQDYGLENNMPTFYAELKQQLTFPWSWQAKKGEMSFDAWRKAAREEIFKTMQLAPPAPDSFAYEVVVREQRDGYVAQKIRFNINKWERITAYLLVPSVTPAPAVLMLHDHGAHFAIGKEKMVRPFGVDSVITADAQQWVEACYDGRYVGDEFARRGYVVLSFDALFWGDRSRKEDRIDANGATSGKKIADALSTKERKQKTYDAQQALASNLLQMGTSWGAWITWDDMRAATFLAQLPMVDKRKVACLGFSMGAYRSWMLAALSDDIKASAAVCWINDTEHLMSLSNNQNKGGSAYSMLIPGIRNLMDYPHVASLICPKPALFFNGDRDKLFPVPGVEASYGVMREVWHSQGKDDRLVTKIWPEKHFLNRAMQEEIADFFDKAMR